MTKSIQIEDLLKAQAFQHENYKIISCYPITGILYLVNNFLSGHIRVRGKGQWTISI